MHALPLERREGDVYTVDADVFALTYRQTGPGTYVKTTPMWAAQAPRAGSVKTKEGVTPLRRGRLPRVE